MNAKRILFATMPMDGHLNPLTGIALHLQHLGHDVRWYTGPTYADKIHKLGIPYYPYRKAQEINQLNLDTVLPQRQRIKGAIARLRFDINQVFLLRAPEFVVDLTEIYQDWPFDLLVCDVVFTGAPFIQQLLNVPVAAIGVVPLSETSKDLPPSGMGLTPARSFLGKQIQSLLRYVTINHLLKPCTDLYNRLLAEHGLPPTQDFVFDAFIRQNDILLQSGTPGFEYSRPNLSPNIRFVGPLLPYSRGVSHPFVDVAKTKEYERVVLVTQGTVERDPAKIISPTLEAFKDDTRTLVIVTTGGSQTAELRKRYPQANMIIEDFIDFNAVMPYVDVYVTNAGYGGVLLAIQHGLPMVAAGLHEGKNEIAARIGYFKLGVNLKTETPTAAQIRRGVEQVLADPDYKQSVGELRNEFARYNPNALCEHYILNLLKQREPTPQLIEA
ncbi:glycosyltransferase family 1 protein [Spirosoma taeanense]|uniref:Glycosyltransferase family 1 protein n=1 Tax=Spirosoma taeanense TaxID=2735870 RepID=A0A6M5Y9Z2_9BACT|nr:glycosyltransferase [Spirosoma taeanense]QJW90033.1 glycosyltransferase family 1 protein [Spirosoma taeanense]